MSTKCSTYSFTGPKGSEVSLSSQDVFDCVIIGDEPAGLWLLQKYLSLHRQLEQDSHPKAPKLKTPRLGWIRFSRVTSAVALPVAAARAFGIEVVKPWSAEIVTPDKTMTWQPSTISERFPELPREISQRLFKSLGPPTAQQLSAIRFALRAQPELLSWAGGLWKYFGRSESHF